MTAPTSDVFQQTFTLSLLSNLAGGYIAADPAPDNAVDPLETQLTQNIQTALANATVQASIGAGWKVVWGPAVWRSSATSRVADNAAVVFYNPATTFEDGTVHPTYVVAVAATNFISSFDWLTEDFDVSTIVDFKTYDPAGTPPFPEGKKYSTTNPVISQGTATGVARVLQLTPYGGESLSSYLAALAKSPPAGARIVFTGHSLAGALTPTTALYLSHHGLLSGFDKALVYPTAGATPGNIGFALDFGRAFPGESALSPKPWQYWNTLIHNAYDVVPHAWYPGSLSQIYGLYGNTPNGNPLPGGLSAALIAAGVNSAASTVLYWPLPDQAFSPSPAPQTPNPTGYEDFFRIVLAQHTTAYADEILGGPLPTIDYPFVPGVIREDTAAKAIEIIIAWIKKLFPGQEQAI